MTEKFFMGLFYFVLTLIICSVIIMIVRATGLSDRAVIGAILFVMIHDKVRER